MYSVCIYLLLLQQFYQNVKGLLMNIQIIPYTSHLAVELHITLLEDTNIENKHTLTTLVARLCHIYMCYMPNTAHVYTIAILVHIIRINQPYQFVLVTNI